MRLESTQLDHMGKVEQRGCLGVRRLRVWIEEYDVHSYHSFYSVLTASSLCYFCKRRIWDVRY